MNIPYIIIGTAPSMDGFASDGSSMIVDGVKVTIASKCPHAIILDTEILAAAPLRMLQAGLGDMLAKYVSICEWRISHIILSLIHILEIYTLQMHMTQVP